eukprot:GHVL01038015.1.p1 GENE.GHVL01038015.1~~GHVL01038015.1.p1  ORF type:complete len:147 (+),score=52.40 GHVL01038015.1:63-443(+)
MKKKNIKEIDNKDDISGDDVINQVECSFVDFYNNFPLLLRCEWTKKMLQKRKYIFSKYLPNVDNIQSDENVTDILSIRWEIFDKDINKYDQLAVEHIFYNSGITVKEWLTDYNKLGKKKKMFYKIG